MYIWLITEVDNSNELLIRQAVSPKQFIGFKKYKGRVFNYFKDKNIELKGAKTRYLKSLKNIEDFGLKEIKVKIPKGTGNINCKSISRNELSKIDLEEFEIPSYYKSSNEEIYKTRNEIEFKNSYAIAKREALRYKDKKTFYKESRNAFNF